MQEYILYLFYLSIILIIGILITAISNKLRISNILFLVLAGLLLKTFNLNYFNGTTILVLSSLALILIVLETSFQLDLAHIMKNFFHVFKFSILHFFIVSYSLTLIVFQLFDLSGKGFEMFVLSFLLSIIIYGVDPNISMEFYRAKKNKIREMLQIEGIISGPIVVFLSIYLINFLQKPGQSLQGEIFTQVFLMGKEILSALVIGIVLAFILYEFLKNFDIKTELKALLILTVAIIAFVVGESIQTNGSFAVVIFGLFLKGLMKNNVQKKYFTLFAHTFYIIVFILLGMEAFFPGPIMWLKGVGLFIAYLILRFFSVFLFLRGLSIKENIFMTLNVAKGIEVAIVLFLIHISLGHLNGVEIILSLGFMFFVLSYITSTAVNYFSDYFLVKRKIKA